MQNLLYENEFCRQFHFHANQSHFHKNGFALSQMAYLIEGFMVADAILVVGQIRQNLQ